MARGLRGETRRSVTGARIGEVLRLVRIGLADCVSLVPSRPLGLDHA
jgi:hypothetical protein